MSEWAPLWVNLAMLSVPFVASFDKRVAFEGMGSVLAGVLVTVTGFIAWDVWFT